MTLIISSPTTGGSGGGGGAAKAVLHYGAQQVNIPQSMVAFGTTNSPFYSPPGQHVIMPFSGTIASISVELSVALGPANAINFEILKNDVPTGAILTMVDPFVLSTILVSVAVVAGDRIGINTAVASGVPPVVNAIADLGYLPT
jgi:hypothetical protein